MPANQFHGGIELERKLWSQHEADLSHIRVMPAPAQLRIPLADANGFCAEPIVDTGDRVLAGQPLSRCDDSLCPPVIASCSGTVTKVDVVNQAVLAIDDSPPMIVISVDSIEQNQCWQLPASEHDVQQLLHLSGIRGLGGAAFPASRKWSSTAQPVSTLIINAAECEPLISCDEALILEQADALIAAIEHLRRSLQAPRCLIGIEVDKISAVTALQDAHDRSEFKAIEVVPVPARYPTGGERQLIRILTGQEVPYGQRPADIGVRCFNIATALAIKQLLVDRVVPTSRIVTVTGNAIRSPVNVVVKFGTPVMDLIRFVEPKLAADFQLTQGGPLSGVTLTNTQGSVTAATNCLLVEHQRTPTEPTSCIRCGHCDDVCPQSLLPQQLIWYCNADNLEEANRFRLDACIECACCDLVCPSQIPLTAQFRTAKQKKRSQRDAETLAERAKERFELREARLQLREQQRQERLAQRKAEIDTRRSKDPRDAIAAALERRRKQRAKNPDKSDKP